MVKYGVQPINMAEWGARAERQKMMLDWARDAFGDGIEVSPGVRLMRFIEEATELAQAHGLSEADVHKVVSYVFKRPPGAPAQEIGGVMVTLMAFCESAGYDLVAAEHREINRVLLKDPEHFRKRAAEKRESELVPEKPRDA